MLRSATALAALFLAVVPPASALGGDLDGGDRQLPDVTDCVGPDIFSSEGPFVHRIDHPIKIFVGVESGPLFETMFDVIGLEMRMPGSGGPYMGAGFHVGGPGCEIV
ncbi:MAG: hypothetical protein QOG31_1669 [Thermoplasmata archaeon]|nr:hypothetical protein [Thermoplasmata archaeon]